MARGVWDLALGIDIPEIARIPSKYSCAASIRAKNPKTLQKDTLRRDGPAPPPISTPRVAGLTIVGVCEIGDLV